MLDVTQSKSAPTVNLDKLDAALILALEGRVRGSTYTGAPLRVRVAFNEAADSIHIGMLRALGLSLNERGVTAGGDVTMATIEKGADLGALTSDKSLRLIRLFDNQNGKKETSAQKRLESVRTAATQIDDALQTKPGFLTTGVSAGTRPHVVLLVRDSDSPEGQLLLVEAKKLTDVRIVLQSGERYARS